MIDKPLAGKILLQLLKQMKIARWQFP